MTKSFKIAYEPFSFRSAVLISDENDEVAYKAQSEWSVSKPSWLLRQNRKLVASFKWRSSGLSIARDSWDIEGDAGNFSIGPQSFSFKRKLHVEGGAYDGATLTGNLSGLQHIIETSNGVELANVSGKIFSLRNVRNVELNSESEADVFFSLLCVVALQITNAMEASRHPR